MKYLKLLRPHHYIKNILIILPLFFSGTFLTSSVKIINVILAFVCFCLISSAIYIINDVRDKEQDKNHPRKSQRPIASGAVSVKAAMILLSVLLVIAGIISVVLLPPISSLFLLAYIVINLLYSFGLKNIPVWDVTCVASGFLLRLVYGAFVTGIVISNWLYLTVIAASFYMALGKRRNELLHKGEASTRKVLEKYTIGFLDKGSTVMLSLTIISYALWSFDAETVTNHGTNLLIWSVPVIILITLKYNLDIEKNTDGDPVEILAHDKSLIALVVLYACLMIALIYLI